MPRAQQDATPRNLKLGIDGAGYMAGIDVTGMRNQATKGLALFRGFESVLAD
jgi:hypothetical protein